MAANSAEKSTTPRGKRVARTTVTHAPPISKYQAAIPPPTRHQSPVSTPAIQRSTKHEVPSTDIIRLRYDLSIPPSPAEHGRVPVVNGSYGQGLARCPQPAALTGMARNSIRIGRVFEIGIYVHWTFVLLMLGIFVYYLVQGNSLPAALAGVGLIAAVFACVVLHELGHALVARRFDVATRDITLYPIGGVARLQRIPDEPMREFWIAVAGPAVNLVIAAALFLYLVARGADLSFNVEESMRASFVSTLMWLNIILVGFNLLPAFPMDGGRVLRALLATRLSYARATELAANVGQGMAILFGLIGVIGFNPILLFIAIFVYIGAQQEARQAMLRTATEGISVGQAMMTRFPTLSADDTLSRAVEELLAGADQDFPVVDGNRLVGILTRKELVKALSEHDRHTPLRAVKLQPCAEITENEMLDRAFVRMQESACSTVAVTRQGAIVGLLTLENVGELMMVSSALRSENPAEKIGDVLPKHSSEPAEAL